MYQSLRPELRGAHRILRSIRPPPSAYTHRVVRSFSSYVRLQEQSSGSDQGKPPNNGKSGDQGIGSLLTHVQDLLKNIAGSPSNQPAGSRDGRIHGSHPVFELSGSDVIKAQAEEKLIEECIAKGEIPPGYKIVERAEDVPGTHGFIHRELGSFEPYLYTEDSDKLTQLYPIKADSPILRHTKSATGSIEAAKEAHLEDAGASQRSDVQDDTQYRGSYRNRRKRARDNKVAATEKDKVPAWFINNNISSPLPEPTRALGVVAVRQLADGTYVPITASLDQVQAQKQPNDGAVETKSEPREQAYGIGGDQPSVGGDSAIPPSIEQGHHSKGHVSLDGDRYFIESAQYQELLHTFKGRLQQPIDGSQKDWGSPFSVNHLTILHGAKDTDSLLDTLVLDLCKTVGANRVRLDIQDISELMAAADVAPEVAEKGGRLSFKVYKDIFGPANIYQDSFFAREEEEEDDEGEDEDQPGPRGSIDIPVHSMVAFPSGGMSKNMFGELTRGLSGPGSPFRRLLGGGNNVINTDLRQGPGLWGHLIESILSTSADVQKAALNQMSTENGDEPAASPPMVLHLPNYRALQSHSLAEGFMGELIAAADKRSRHGQRIIVIGTDSMRDFSTSNNPRAILDEQEHRSYGASSSIVLTPVFPNREAELALLRDREKKIRDVNVRHLYNVLKSRGVLLKGLEEGFWHKDYSAELGEADFNALGDIYWPFIHVQRVAAMIAGNDLSQTPISDAVETLTQSDESKVAWARRTQPDIVKEDFKESEKPENKRMRSLRSKATRHEKKLLSGVIEPKKISTTFSDIHIPAETVEALQTLTTLSLQRPEAFKYGVLKSDRIPGLLLYGPPGTGKTLAAKAVAKESGATMLEVSAADLNDMYVGEGEKNVQALFSLAKKLSPCVVFLDEADAMFSARSAQGRRVSHRELLNQFLKEWDGMSNDAGSAFIMVATNRPMDLDDAVLRRLPRRLLVDLPTEQDRLEILKIHLRHEVVDENVNMSNLAKKTPFYSGSDLKNVAVAAALNAVREENEAAKKYRQENPDSEEQYTYPEKRVLTQPHFDKALEEISASISEDMSSLREIKKFDEQYGDRKGRKRKTPRWGFKSAVEADKVLDTVKVRS
ncbi:hypothetical protein OHC33_000456 [Knufia fluminis]|uniref:AAA+ ATPase domain-containing protein n=1 Tax=Knufia fluminis TaxID=191047 RepID=A0AAN8ETK4_9EURO|nr:hypothetical protein OHC33_000456 [Knufia fluminis]